MASDAFCAARRGAEEAEWIGTGGEAHEDPLGGWASGASTGQLTKGTNSDEHPGRRSGITSLAAGLE